MGSGISKVGNRLTLAFTGMLALMLAVVAVAYLALGDANRQANKLSTIDLQVLKAAGAMQAAQYEQAVAIREFVSNEDTSAQKAARAALAASRAAYAESAEQIEKLATELGHARIIGMAQQLKAAQGPVTQGINQAIEFADNAQYQEAGAQVYKNVRPLQTGIAAQLDQLVDIASDQVQSGAETMYETARNARAQMLAALALALALGVIATIRLTRGITHPLNAAVATTERIAAGDLAVVVASGGTDETGRLLTALAQMKNSLHDMAVRIRDGAVSVSAGVQELASGNLDLSQRTEGQAASIEETVASIEELTATVKQNADNAAQASTMATRAAQVASDSGQLVERMVDAMDGIQSSSRRIADIVGVIDGISFQTNILALNAAVEAARAGEQGRGFAVVAAEVRSLAQRSAVAAKEIKELIGDGVEKVGVGTQLAGEVGQTISQTVAAANDASRLVAEISTATQEQYGGIEQIAKAIALMDNLTQRNAGLVEENNAATEVLRSQAQGLVETVSRFRLHQTTPAILPSTGRPNAPAHGETRLATLADSGTRRPLLPT